jgi:DNA-binding response OmpR family regulator
MKIMTGKELRILLIDDEPVILDIYTGIFEKDFSISTAVSGEEALSIIPAFMPDVVVLDAIMHGIDGWEVCRQIKESEMTRSIKVIMVSARAISREDREKAYGAGADDYLIKPFIHEDIFSKVHIWARVKKNENRIQQEVAALKMKQEELIKSKTELEQKLNEYAKELLLLKKK